MAARALYETLFSLERDTDRLKASHELVWGHSPLSWQVSGEDVRYPLLITGVLIHVDETDGSISVIPDGPTDLQLNPLEGLSLSMIDDLTRLQERLRQDPPNQWDAENLAQVHGQLLAPLGLDARISPDSLIPPPSAEPVITDTWTLFLRPRPTRHDRFYQELAELLRDGSVLPQALAAVVSDDDQVRLAQAELGHEDSNDWRVVGERLLMPLPANAEQERIARQLARARGVTVQGPPGTGKSHTIANLVSHLLAHGKRVLVTAQNEQALSVLRDKIPLELRDLSIAVLGSSSESMEQLRGSAQTVMDIASSVDAVSETRAVAALSADLDTLRERLRRAELAVLEALRTEDAEFPLPSGPTRAPDVARWLTEHEPLLNRIPDALSEHAAIPLSPQELHELFDLSAALTPQDVIALSSHRPRAPELPTAGYLADLAERIERSRHQVGELERRGLDLAAVDRTSPQKLAELQSYTQECAEFLAPLEIPWLSKLFSDLRRSPETARLWGERSELFAAQVGAATELHRSLFGHEIRVPPGDHRLQQELLDKFLERLGHGKPMVPLLGGGDLKQLHAGTTVDGLPMRTPAEVRLVKVQVELGVQLQIVQRLVGQLAEQVPLPVPQSGPRLLDELNWLRRQLTTAMTWQVQVLPSLHSVLGPFLPGLSAYPTSAELGQATQLLGEAEHRGLERLLHAEHQALVDLLDTGTGMPGASPLWTVLRQALETGNWQLWTETQAEAARLSGLVGPTARRDELAKRLAAAAPAWAGAIVRSCADPDQVGRPENSQQMWSWRQAATWLEDLLRRGDLRRLQSEVLQLQQEEQATILQIARRGAAVGLKENLKDRNRRALSSWLNALAKRGKGSGKYSAHWEAEARSHLPAAMGAVPVWIMPVHRVIENFDPRVTDLFDVVIVDESSQCDLLSVGILALGVKAVVVGDDRQTSPAAVGVNQERIMRLQETHLPDVIGKNLLTADQSLYSLSELIFPSTILLREHFRCVPEIIDFSSRRYYNGEILPLREPSRAPIGEPLQLVPVPDGACTGSASADRLNRREAQVLVDQVGRCHENPAYEGFTFGVVTLQGSAQGPLIESLLRERLGVEAFTQRRLRVGNPAAFQGDERNIIFISVVADDNKWAATKRSDGQRINVAASRAQDQVWVFHTVDPSTLHADDERRALVEYVRDAGSREVQTADLESRCESKFESDVLRELLARGYELQVQHAVGRYRIDLVVAGENGRLAIECDGDRFHGPEQWEHDIRRQRQLERLGWTFWRIRASEFYRERPETLAALIHRLNELDIQPHSAWAKPAEFQPREAEPEPIKAEPEPIEAEPTESEPTKSEQAESTPAEAEPTDAEPDLDESSSEIAGQETHLQRPANRLQPKAAREAKPAREPKPARSSRHDLSELLARFDFNPDFTQTEAEHTERRPEPAADPRGSQGEPGTWRTASGKARTSKASGASRSPRAVRRLPPADVMPALPAPVSTPTEDADAHLLKDAEFVDSEVTAPETEAANADSAGEGLRVPDGYRSVGWIRPHEAHAVMNAYIEQREVAVIDATGTESGVAQYYPADDPQAKKYRAQVMLSRHRKSAVKIVAWVRDYEAEAILTAVSLEEDFAYEHPEQQGCLVQYFDPDGTEAATYRSPTRLLRRRTAAGEGPARAAHDDSADLEDQHGSEAGATLIIKRAWVEEHDLSAAEKLLADLMVSPVAILAAQEQVSVSFEGYDQILGLPEIPEVRDYIHALDERFPFWLFFLPKDTAALALVLRCLLPAPPGSEDFRRALAARLESRWLPAMDSMAHRAGLTAEQINELTERTVDYIVPDRR